MRCRSAQQRGELAAILEAAVQPLAVEWHDRVRRIAEQQDAAFDLPAFAVQRAEPALRVHRELLGEVRDGACGIGELALK